MEVIWRLSALGGGEGLVAFSMVFWWLSYYDFRVSQTFFHDSKQHDTV